jgi:hypothetical protein
LEPGKAGLPLDATCKRLLQFANLFKKLNCPYLQKLWGFAKPSTFSLVGTIPAIEKPTLVAAWVKCNQIELNFEYEYIDSQRKLEHCQGQTETTLCSADAG